LAQVNVAFHEEKTLAMTKVVLVVFAATLALPQAVATASVRRAGLLELQRRSDEKTPPAFAAPDGTPLKLEGFCQRPDKKAACTQKPCCCWSTFGADKHPAYPSPEEAKSKQLCLNPPKGFAYAPEPGLTFDAGYLDTLRKANLPVYEGRRLCCLRNANGVQDESQRDMTLAVKTPKKLVVTTAQPASVPEVGEVAAAFTTKKPEKPPGMQPGDEYETAKMEAAARAHMAAALTLSKTVASLNASATAIEEVQEVLSKDRNMVAGQKRVAKLRAAIRAWSGRRWANLKKLKEAAR